LARNAIASAAASIAGCLHGSSRLACEGRQSGRADNADPLGRRCSIDCTDEPAMRCAAWSPHTWRAMRARSSSSSQATTSCDTTTATTVANTTWRTASAAAASSAFPARNQHVALAAYRAGIILGSRASSRSRLRSRLTSTSTVRVEPVGLAPGDRVDQLVAREHASSVLGQRPQQSELAGRKHHDHPLRIDQVVRAQIQRPAVKPILEEASDPRSPARRRMLRILASSSRGENGFAR